MLGREIKKWADLYAGLYDKYNKGEDPYCWDVEHMIDNFLDSADLSELGEELKRQFCSAVVARKERAT